MRIGINGLGRIGRAIFRLNQKHADFEIAAINETNPDNKNIEYLLKYDSTYGKSQFQVSSTKKALFVEGQRIEVYHHANISKVPWKKHGVDMVIDSTGAQNIGEMKKCRGKVKSCLQS